MKFKINNICTFWFISLKYFLFVWCVGGHQFQHARDKGRCISVRCQVEGLTGPAWSSERISFLNERLRVFVRFIIQFSGWECHATVVQLKGHMNLALGTPGPLVSIFWCDRSLKKKLLSLYKIHKDIWFFSYLLKFLAISQREIQIRSWAEGLPLHRSP